MHYYRTPGQINSLIHDYEDEILKLEKMINEEDNEKREKYLKELRDEHLGAKKRLERFLDDCPNIFK